MIVRKLWQSVGNANRPGGGLCGYTDTWEGWFLFGVIPLYMIRHDRSWGGVR